MNKLPPVCTGRVHAAVSRAASVRLHLLTTPGWSVDSLPPGPPDSVFSFCCYHLALVDGSRPDSEQAWIDLPSRHMAWVPVRRPLEGRWGPEWICLRCGSCLTMRDPLLQGVPSRVPAARVDLCSPFLPCPWDTLPVNVASTPPPEPPCSCPLPGSTRPSAAGAAAGTSWISRGPPDASAPKRAEGRMGDWPALACSASGFLLRSAHRIRGPAPRTAVLAGPHTPGRPPAFFVRSLLSAHHRGGPLRIAMWLFRFLGRSSSALSKIAKSLQLLWKRCCRCSSVSGGLPRSRLQPTASAGRTFPPGGSMCGKTSGLATSGGRCVKELPSRLQKRLACPPKRRQRRTVW